MKQTKHLNMRDRRRMERRVLKNYRRQVYGYRCMSDYDIRSVYSAAIARIANSLHNINPEEPQTLFAQFPMYGGRVETGQGNWTTDENGNWNFHYRIPPYPISIYGKMK